MHRYPSGPWLPKGSSSDPSRFWQIYTRVRQTDTTARQKALQTLSLACTSPRSGWTNLGSIAPSHSFLVFLKEAGAQIRKRTDTRGKNVRAHKTKKQRSGKKAAILKEVS